MRHMLADGEAPHTIFGNTERRGKLVQLIDRQKGLRHSAIDCGVNILNLALWDGHPPPDPSNLNPSLKAFPRV